MPGRIRTIKPEILEDEVACNLSDAAWRVWVSSWLLADDYGHLRAGARFIASQVWQDTDKTNASDVALSELETAGLITLYSVEGQRYCSVNGWAKHQRVDHQGKPRVPGPDHPDAIAHCKVNSRDSRKVSETFGKLPQLSESCGKKKSDVSEEEFLAASRAHAPPHASDLRPPTSDPDQRPTTNDTEGECRGGDKVRDEASPRPEPAQGPSEEDSGSDPNTPESSSSNETAQQSDICQLDDSLPTDETKTSGKGKSVAGRAKREPKPDLVPSELSPEATQAHEAIATDASLAPIVPRPCQTATDLVKAAPGVNVAREIAKAGAWLRANPTKAKKNGAAFLLNWVTRAQERGGGGPLFGNRGGYPVQRSGIPGHLAAVLKREQAEAEAERAARLANTPDDGLEF